jgi:hypothetical protein
MPRSNAPADETPGLAMSSNNRTSQRRLLMYRRRFVIGVTLFIATLGMTAAFAAGKSEINTARDLLAMHGYDAVAYRTDGRPVKGSPSFVYRWKGAVWQFASAAHRDEFAKEPARYAPEFGGYCAYAVSRGHTADGDPTVWRIVNGRLYLNYSKSVQKQWEEDVPGNIAKGQHNWPQVLGQ